MKKRSLSKREERILLLLKRFDFLTRDQLNRFFKLGTVRNTNRVLSELADYLMTVRDGYQTTYYLSRIGRDYVGCQKIRKKGGRVKHTVMRNELWLYYGCPRDWKNEVKVSDGKTKLVVDSMFTKDTWHHFLEVDHLQSMSENRKKIERYKELYANGLVARTLGHFPTVLWLTTTELRRKQLEEACKGLPRFRVYTLTDIQ